MGKWAKDKLKTGRYDTREELEEWVWYWYFDKDLKPNDIARGARISESLCRTIINIPQPIRVEKRENYANALKIKEELQLEFEFCDVVHRIPGVTMK